jgi:hypothetical protein
MFPIASNSDDEKLYVDDVFSTYLYPGSVYGASISVPGINFDPYAYSDSNETTYSTPGTYTFTVPTGVTSVCAVAIGGGGGGCDGYIADAIGNAGGGGALSYVNDISVTPGQQITVTVGSGGSYLASTGNGTNNAGGNSSLGSFVVAGGGRGGSKTASGGAGGTVITGTGGAGGAGGGGTGSSYSYFGGGGGAGGYSGAGGAGGQYMSAEGQIAPEGSGGGGGGGASGSSLGQCGIGGGTSLYGQAANGQGGVSLYYKHGGCGSTWAGKNRYTGFGRGGITSGGDGAVRIIWGVGRSFPSNAGGTLDPSKSFLFWGKRRDGIGSHYLWSPNVGFNKYLSSDSTNSATTSTDGIVGGSSGSLWMESNSLINQSFGFNYTSCVFRKAAKFFDVVTYTGNEVAGRQIAHSLGVAPGMIIVKRTDTTGNWQVYHRSLTSAANSIQLNLDVAQASAPTVWNSTAPTSSVFSVGTDATVNASGGTYVAYLYAHDTSSTGIIQCGSYTGDGAAKGTLVNLGWEPQWLLVKMSNSSGYYWILTDSLRGLPTGSNDASLYPNVSSAEGSSINQFDLASTGFYPIDPTNANVSGKTYIYMAIRRPNKPPTTGTQVYNAVTYMDASLGSTYWTNVGSSNLGTTDLFMHSINNSVDTFMGEIHTRLTGKGLNTTSTGIEPQGDTLVFDAQKGVNVPYNGRYYVASAIGRRHIAWMFTRAPGFFDVVCYTGTGVATTQAHNLGAVPELIIVKNRTDTRNWAVYTASTGVNALGLLDLTNAFSFGVSNYWDTLPTSSVFSIGTEGRVNISGDTYVAYLFATLAGISKVGSYTGNGTSQNIECGFAAGARFVLIKATSTTGDWLVADTTRGIVSGNDPRLSLNSTAAEVTGEDWLDPYAPGFTVNQTTASANASGVSYIFLAIS